MKKISRRHALYGVATLAAGSVGLDARQQRPPAAATLTGTAAEIASLHGVFLGDIVTRLKGQSMTSRAGAGQLLTFLGPDTFPGDQAKTVAELLDIVCNNDLTLDEMQRRLNALIERAAKEAGELLRAVLDIARDSLRFLSERLKDPKTARVAAVVASDVTGALAGIATAAKVSSHPLVLALGAAAGALPASAKAWDEFVRTAK
ncbi:MAG: hypothetical protein AB1635_20520 [Acidobacteriota bacterium]